MTLNRSDVVVHLVGRLLMAAEEAGANCIVTACPLCQMNLDSRQSRRKPGMPIFYFTELVGLALGLEAAGGWLAKHITDPRPMLREIGLW